MSQRIAYRSAGPFVARQGFDFGPRHVESGEPFDPADHGALEHQVYGLWLAQQVDVAPAAPAKKAKAPKQPGA